MSVQSVFPLIGGISISPVSGVNFNSDSRKLSPRVMEMVKNGLEHYQKDPFVVYEFNSGVGILTSLLAGWDKTNAVFAYQQDDKQLEFLKRNVSTYRLGSKVYLYDTSMSIIRGSTLIVNMISGGLLEGHPPSVIANGYKDVVYGLGFIAPKGTPFENVEGMSLQGVEVDNFLVGFYFHNPIPEFVQKELYGTREPLDPTKSLMEWVDPSFPSVPLMPVGFQIKLPSPQEPKAVPKPATKAAPKPSAKVEAKVAPKPATKAAPKPSTKVEAKVAPKPEAKSPGRRDLKMEEFNLGRFDEIVKTLPIQNKEEGAWLSQLQRFVYLTLSTFIGDQARLLRMVDSEAMKVWAKAFTHETFSREYNYESLETMGDAVLKYCFPKLLFERFPDITPGKITNLRNFYMSKVFQASVSQKLKLSSWIRISTERITISVHEDLFESFFGALDHVGDSIEPGMGSVLSMNFLRFIFRDFVFDKNREELNSKTKINQTARRLKWGENGITETSTEKNGIHTMTITVSEEGLRYLRDHGMGIENPLGVGTGTSQAQASENAYSEADRKFTEIGLTMKLVDRLRAEIVMNEVASLPQGEEVVKQALRKVAEFSPQAYIHFEIVRSSSNLAETIVQMIIWISEENSRKISDIKFSSTKGELYEKTNQARLRLLESYIKN
jgi:dsRNA-specific ribonuclease